MHYFKGLRFPRTHSGLGSALYKLQNEKQVPLLREHRGSDIRVAAAPDSQCPDPQSLPSTFLPKLPFSAPIQTLVPASPNQQNGFQTAGIIIISLRCLQFLWACPVPSPSHPPMASHQLRSSPGTNSYFPPPCLAYLQPHLPRGFSLPTSSVSSVLLLLELDLPALFLDSFHCSVLG